MASSSAVPGWEGRHPSHFRTESNFIGKGFYFIYFLLWTLFFLVGIPICMSQFKWNTVSGPRFQQAPADFHGYMGDATSFRTVVQEVLTVSKTYLGGTIKKTSST